MPVKREHPSDIDELDSDIDTKPTLNDITSTKKTKSNPTTPSKRINRTASSASRKKENKSGSPKKMGSWSGEELKLLYAIMCPKRVGINWTEVSKQIEGRDAKACNNKWTRMQSKIIQAIENMGE